MKTSMLILFVSLVVSSGLQSSEAQRMDLKIDDVIGNSETLVTINDVKAATNICIGFVGPVSHLVGIEIVSVKEDKYNVYCDFPGKDIILLPSAPLKYHFNLMKGGNSA